MKIFPRFILLCLTVTISLTWNCCATEPEKKAQTVEEDGPQQETTKPGKTNRSLIHKKYKSIKEIITDTNILHHWLSPSYYPELFFSTRKDTVDIVFDGQCMYSYPYKTKENIIVVNYAFAEDCTHLIGIRKKFKVKSPKIGKPFIELTLINDSILKANYLYPEWKDSVNSTNPDYPYLPEFFHCLQ